MRNRLVLSPLLWNRPALGPSKESCLLLNPSEHNRLLPSPSMHHLLLLNPLKQKTLQPKQSTPNCLPLNRLKLICPLLSPSKQKTPSPCPMKQGCPTMMFLMAPMICQTLASRKMYHEKTVSHLLPATKKLLKAGQRAQQFVLPPTASTSIAPGDSE